MDQAPGTDDESAVRWGNLIIWTLVAIAAALLGVFLVPLTTPGGVLIPIAPLVVLIANVALPRQVYLGTGWGWTKAVPAAVWIIVALAGAAVSSDGDLLIPGDSHSSLVGLAYLALGAMGAIIGLVLAGTDLRRLVRRPRE